MVCLLLLMPFGTSFAKIITIINRAASTVVVDKPVSCTVPSFTEQGVEIIDGDECVIFINTRIAGGYICSWHTSLKIKESDNIILIQTDGSIFHAGVRYYPPSVTAVLEEHHVNREDPLVSIKNLLFGLFGLTTGMCYTYLNLC